MNHPVVGTLPHRDKLPVDGLLLVLYYADQGSESDEKLRLLASRVQTAPAPGTDRAKFKSTWLYKFLGVYTCFRGS